jgi:NDP-sugar pyrophosphorylase family protein
MLEKDVIPRLIGAGKIRGYLFDGQWFDVGTPEIYQRAIREWTG